MIKARNEKAKELREDIDYLKNVVKEYEETSHWIKVSTPKTNNNYCMLNLETQEKIHKFIKSLIVDIEHELEELN